MLRFTLFCKLAVALEGSVSILSDNHILCLADERPVSTELMVILNRADLAAYLGEQGAGSVLLAATSQWNSLAKTYSAENNLSSDKREIKITLKCRTWPQVILTAVPKSQNWGFFLSIVQGKIGDWYYCIQLPDWNISFAEFQICPQIAKICLSLQLEKQSISHTDYYSHPVYDL